MDLPTQKLLWPWQGKFSVWMVGAKAIFSWKSNGVGGGRQLSLYPCSRNKIVATWSVRTKESLFGLFSWDWRVGGPFRKRSSRKCLQTSRSDAYKRKMVDVGEGKGNNWRRKVFKKVRGGWVLQDKYNDLPLIGRGTFPSFQHRKRKENRCRFVNLL